MDLHICDLAQTFTLNALSDATLRDLHVQTTCVRLHHGAALLFSQNMLIFFFFFFFDRCLQYDVSVPFRTAKS